MTKTVEQRLAEIDLSKHPVWYRAKLEAAIRQLGTKWQLHPVHTLDFTQHRKAA